MPSTYEVLSPNGHYTMAESIFTKLKDYMDAHGPGSKVDRAGDTMTGALNMSNVNIVVTDTDIDSDVTPSSDVWGDGYYLKCASDTSSNQPFGYLRAVKNTNGYQGVQIETNRYISGTRYFNNLNLKIDDRGTNVVEVADASAWRTGLNVVNKSGDTMTGTLNFTTTNGIGYSGVYATYPMIKFIDATDVNGNGIVIGGGGASIMGGGESSTVMAEQVSNGGSEILYLGNDGNVDIFSNLQNGWASRRHVAFNTNGSLVFDDTVTANVIIPARSVSYIQGNNGNAGIYAKKTLNTDQWYPIICMDTKAGGSWAVGNYNNEHFQFSYATKANRDANNNSTSIMYMQAGDTGRIVTTSTLSTGDSNGQIKIAGTNVSVKGLGSAAYLNADTANTANTVVKRDANKYIYAQYYNAACGADSSATNASYFIYANSDGWFRKASRLNAAKALTDQAVSSPGYVVGLTTSWGSFGYTTIAQLKSQFGYGTIVTKNTGDYLPIGGGTITGGVTMNSTCSIKGSLSCYAGIELRASTNYIDFHVNQSSADYTARIIESSSGKLTAYNSISNSSDRRLKKDIEDLDITYIELLNEVRPRQFRYIKGDEFLYTGFIAQEFEDAMKEVGIIDIPVVTPPNNIDEYYGLDYGQVTAILWKICQHQQSEIDELKSKIA